MAAYPVHRLVTSAQPLQCGAGHEAQLLQHAALLHQPLPMLQTGRLCLKQNRRLVYFMLQAQLALGTQATMLSVHLWSWAVDTERVLLNTHHWVEGEVLVWHLLGHRPHVGIHAPGVLMGRISSCCEGVRRVQNRSTCMSSSMLQRCIAHEGLLSSSAAWHARPRQRQQRAHALLGHAHSASMCFWWLSSMSPKAFDRFS